MSSALKSNLDLVAACDNFPYEPEEAQTYYKLYLPGDGRPHGYINPSVVNSMPWTKAFEINHQAHTVTLLIPPTNQELTTFCNTAFQEVIDAIISQNTFRIVGGTHSEYYRIPGANHAIQLERFAVPLFGTTTRGAHLTAYTRKANGDLLIWVPRRSQHLKTYPNKLDSTVAGGVRAHETPFETIIHEADEEASLPAPFVQSHTRSSGVVTYMHRTGPDFFAEQDLVYQDMLYVYDLELPSDMVPKPRDDEVKEFYAMGVEEVKIALGKGEFKPNSALVMLDFFVRHGVVSAENEVDFVEICSRMRRRAVFPVVGKGWGNREEREGERGVEK